MYFTCVTTTITRHIYHSPLMRITTHTSLHHHSQQHTAASSAKSGVQSYKKVFTEFEWSIKDFSHHATGRAALISPAFYTEPKDDGEKVRWYLNCYVGCSSDKVSSIAELSSPPSTQNLKTMERKSDGTLIATSTRIS